VSAPLPTIREHEPMARHTSWRAGGPARFYAEPVTPAEALALARWAREQGIPLIWAGRGTNTLVRDAGFSGLVAAYRAQRWELEEDGDSALLRVEAGAPMAGTARRMAAMGWDGMTWAEGLPGTVGGAVFGNAGCYGGDTAGLLHSAELLVGDEIETWPVERLGYGYRTSVLKTSGRTTDDGRRTTDEGRAANPDAGAVVGGPSSVVPLIVAATFRLRRGEPGQLAARMAAIAAERKGKTPTGSSCGSVFKNPPGESAGRLVERAGLKGRQAGGAMISPLHGNYIVNTGGATAADILELIATIQKTVRERFDIELELEVRVV
jgi:UDP-N-acetylmuramate dehydrogenase